MSPATAQAQQTTAATPSTAVTPSVPVTPRKVISSAASSSVEIVSPETGFEELPTTPTR